MPSLWPISTWPPASKAAATPGADEEEGDKAGPVNYSLLEIASPKPEETLWNIEGVLNVSLNVQPALQPGQQVRVYFDGEPRMVNGSSFQIEEVWRGVHNIQVEIPGSVHPDQWVVIGAHYDHVGIRVPVAGDSIYNGAADNALPLACMLETARMFSELDSPPRRSVLFVAVTAEEPVEYVIDGISQCSINPKKGGRPAGVAPF